MKTPIIASVKDIKIGKGHPISIQTMYDSPIPSKKEDLDKLLARMNGLSLMGCDIMRFSYPSDNDRDAFIYLNQKSSMPLVADIHFDFKMALAALDCGFSKIRINPGNIGARWKVDEIVRSANDKGAAIRIGLNSGSLPKGDGDATTIMVDNALKYLEWFEELNFYNTVVSLKSTNLEETRIANELFYEKSNYPIHIGVTEAGSVVSSVARSTWVLGNLIKQGIGDTMRISITGDIEDEVFAGVEILRTLGLRDKGVRIISCPRCGRNSFDSIGFLKEIEPDLLKINKNISVAIMGCQVNGPGEAKAADFAITGIGNKVFLYKKGKLSLEVDYQNAKSALLEAINGE
ncbi:MAG: 4-hydroxy-3-methylbut-2-en-1-yl diphosphate synthase [Spirochaetia bacterium]|nr:4-hydroxy-3-methylbut-2-en-1-yl diphosphate synthase [Spirochaetia bacterium]